MIQANISTVKSHLSRYLDHVKGGEEVLIAERNRPVAKLVPCRSGDGAAGGWPRRLAELERLGRVRRAPAKRTPWRLVPAPAPKGGAKVLEALLDERRSGR